MKTYSIDRIMNHWPAAPSYRSGDKSDDIKPRTENGRLDIHACLEKTKLEGLWHAHMRDAVASMIGLGWSDEAIRLSCAPYCTGGHTDADLAPMIDGARKKWDRPNPNEHTPINFNAYSLEHMLNDASPMPQDLIGPRVLTPGGTLVLGGAPKVGKSSYILHLLCHAAAGVSFLHFTIARPLRIFYLQAEIQYDYLRERLQQVKLPAEVIEAAKKNLFVTPQLQHILNDEGLEAVIKTIRECFPDNPPDVIAIDPIRNVFDGGEKDEGLGESSNTAMMFFLRQRVEKIRMAINPNAGNILVHHTKKLSKQQFAEEPFQAFSGANSLRGYYSSGMVIFKPDEKSNVRQLFFELRNGPPMDPIYADFIEGKWQEVDANNIPLMRKDYAAKLNAERARKKDVILETLYEQAKKGHLYNANLFSQKFEGSGGLGSATTIQGRIEVLMTKGYIKSFKAEHPLTGAKPARSKLGFLCVEDMMVGPEKINETTGEFIQELIPIKPTHFKCATTGALLPVENPDVWVYQDDEADLVSAPENLASGI